MYESFSDERLRELSARPQDLTEPARLALQAEVERRGLFAPDVDPPLAEGATPCVDHPRRAVVGTCRRCGRFICYRCDAEVGAQLRSLPERPPQGLCRPCRALVENAGPSPGIGGWLILLALGLVLSPLQQLRSIYLSFEFLRGSELSPLGQGLVLVDVMVSAALIGLMVWTASRFFSKKTNAPSLMIGTLVAGVAQLLLQLGMEHVLDGEVVWNDGATTREVVGTVARAAIWVTYLKLSKRVRETFIVP